MKINKLFVSGSLLIAALLLPAAMVAQQPQVTEPNPQSLQGINSKWTNGVAPGYYPKCSPATCSSTLTLSVGPGTCFDSSGSRHTYAGGTLTMTGSATNYVYLAQANCSLTQNTTGYPSTGSIPIAAVVATSTITGITDDRTFTSSAGNARRICAIIIGADNATAALVNGDIAPQGRQCFVPYAATVIEVEVAADGGTPSVIVDNNHAGSKSNLLSAALATASAGGIACSNTSGTTGLDGTTTCSATLQNTSIAAGDYLETTSATAGGTAKRMSIFITFVAN